MRSAIIFGVNSHIASVVTSDMRVLSVVDSSPKQQQTFFLGHQVCAPDTIYGLDADLIIIGSFKKNEILADIERLNVTYRDILGLEDIGILDNRGSKYFGYSDQTELVSIIMPTFNRAEIILKSLDSVAQQSYQSIELIIVDDGSADHTKEVVGIFRRTAQFPIYYEKLTTNSGVSMARNAGLRKARGSVIAYLDSDNAWNPRFLEIMLKFLWLSGKATGYCGINIFEDDFRDAKSFGYPFVLKQLAKRNFIDLNVFIHRSSILSNIGLFNETIKRLVDWEFIVRATRRYPPFFCPLVLCDYDNRASQVRITTSQDWSSNYMTAVSLIGRSAD